MKKIIFYLFFLSITSVTAQHNYDANWESLDKRATPGWIENAKFGRLIHWGVYSVPSWAPTSGDVYSRYAEWYSRNTFPTLSRELIRCQYHSA